MFYAVVIGVICGVSGVFSVMVCCGSGKMKSKRDRDLEDREQLEFLRNWKRQKEKREGKC